MGDDAPTTVYCSRLKRELPAIKTRLSFAGPFGERVRDSVSQEAWNEWLPNQIKVINEYRLHMGEPAHQKHLQEIAARFFCFDGGDGSLGSPGPQGGLD
jgi:Fe-S cluster biosynthesis and repair protein YggX